MASIRQQSNLKLESTQTSIHDLAKTTDDTVIVIAGSK